PVHKAAEQGDISKLTSLVHSAENIDDYDMYGVCTPLHLAIQGDHAEAVKILLEAGADPEKLDYSDTALDPPHPAVDLVAWITIKTMVDAGASFEVTNQSLRTPLHLAQTRAIADFLCSLGANTSAKDDQGQMPLHTACHKVLADVVDLLISRNPSVNEIATKDQFTPLHFATCGRHGLTSHIYVPEESWNRETSICRLQTVQVLLKNGANIQAATSDGLTALHGAAHKGDINLTRFLLEQGANVNAPTVAGETALHTVMAIDAFQAPTESQISAMATLLLEYGANLETKDGTGATPL
ncbi:hypothetical protein COCC4DRAFT_118690, partial [Bipolaris maydis ATCC 48331]